MSDVKIKITLQDTIEDIIDNVGSSSEVNNVSIQKSNAVFNSLSTKNSGKNMKSWATGVLSLSDGYVGGSNTQLVNQYGYNGYVFGTVPKTKKFTVTMEFIGENVDSIIIYGDKNANQFPTKAYLDSNSRKYIYSDDPIWAIRFDNPSNSHKITFLEWNRGDYNACITYVAVLKNELELDKSYIKNIESLSQITAQPKEIYYGSLENRGDLEIYDIDKEFVDYINDGVLPVNNLPISVYVGENKIQEHITEDTEYAPYTFVMSMPLSNKFDKLSESKQTINIRDFVSSTSDKKGATLKYILQYFVFNNENIDNKLKNKTIVRLPVEGGEYAQYKEVTIDEYLSNIRIPYVFFNDKSKKDILNEICNLAQMNYVIDDNGNDVFVSGKPIILKDTKTIISLDKKNIVGQISKDVIVKNKYDKVSFNLTKIDVSQEYVYDKNIYMQIDTNADPDAGGDGYIPSKTYDISNIGNEAKIIDGEFDTTSITYNGYLCFFDSINYTSEKFYRFNLNQNQTTESAPQYVKIKHKTDEYQNNTATIYTSPYVEMSEKSKDEYDFNNELGYVRVLDSDDQHDNNKPYNIAISINIKSLVSNRNGAYYRYPVENIEVKLLASVYNVSTIQKSYGDGNNVYEFTSSSLLQTNSVYQYNYGLNEIPLDKFISEDILTNYANGIKTCKCSVTCSTYYDVDGNKAIDWDKNEILKIGDFVKLYNDDMVWKVVGRTFRKLGVPMIDLDLMQVIEVDKIVEI